MVKKDPVCRKRDCRYHSIRVGSACVGSCSYLDITVKTTLGQLTPARRRLLIKGKIQCPFYEPGGRDPRKSRPVEAIFPQPRQPKRHTEKREKMLKLYRDGLNDKQIADLVGCTRDAVWQWRRSENLPPNSPRGYHRDKRELMR